MKAQLEQQTDSSSSDGGGRGGSSSSSPYQQGQQQGASLDSHCEGESGGGGTVIGESGNSTAPSSPLPLDGTAVAVGIQKSIGELDWRTMELAKTVSKMADSIEVLRRHLISQPSLEPSPAAAAAAAAASDGSNDTAAEQKPSEEAE